MITATQLNQIATDLSGKPTTVMCQSWAGHDASVQGYVEWNNGQVIPVIHLPFLTCKKLVMLDKRRNPYPIAWWTTEPGGHVMDYKDGSALATLAHEADHIGLASADEAQVECYNFNHRLHTIHVVEKYMHLAKWFVPQLLWGMWADHHDTLPIYQQDC